MNTVDQGSIRLTRQSEENSSMSFLDAQFVIGRWQCKVHSIQKDYPH